jgi:hypothetical protein
MTSVQDPQVTDADFVALMNLLGIGEDNTSTDGESDADFIDRLLADCADSINEGPFGDKVVAKPVRGEGRHHKINLHHPETDEVMHSFGVTL